MTAIQVSCRPMLDHSERCAGIADHHKFAVFVIIANVVAHIWRNGGAQESLVAIHFYAASGPSISTKLEAEAKSFRLKQ